VEDAHGRKPIISRLIAQADTEGVGEGSHSHARAGKRNVSAMWGESESGGGEG